jgi:hypothetical protein
MRLGNAMSRRICAGRAASDRAISGMSSSPVAAGVLGEFQPRDLGLLASAAADGR